MPRVPLDGFRTADSCCLQELRSSAGSLHALKERTGLSAEQVKKDLARLQRGTFLWRDFIQVPEQLPRGDLRRVASRPGSEDG